MWAGVGRLLHYVDCSFTLYLWISGISILVIGIYWFSFEGFRPRRYDRRGYDDRNRDELTNPINSWLPWNFWHDGKNE